MSRTLADDLCTLTRIGTVQSHHRVADAYQSFVGRRIVETASGGSAQLPYSQNAWHLLNAAIEQLLDGRDPDAYLVFDDEDQVFWILVIVNDAAHLLRIVDETAELRFVGQLRGTYTETLSIGPYGIDATLLLKHPRLPNGALELAVPAPSPYAHRSAVDADHDAQFENLRAAFRRWASYDNTAPVVSPS